MSPLRLILASLVHHWRMNVAVALGVMAGTAVLTGALLVGDSVRGSLRRLTLDRLGRIDAALVSDRFFRVELAGELEQSDGFADSFQRVVPALLLQAAASQPDSGAQSNIDNLVAAGRDFWDLAPGPQPPQPGPDEVVLNQPLADELQVEPGDDVIVRLPQPSEIPGDSPLGRKTDTIANRRLRVIAVIAAEGLGRFGLRPNQQLPKNAYLDLAALEQALEQPRRANALLVAGKTVEPAPLAAVERLQQSLRPQLDDFGLSLVRTERGYFNLTSERMLLEPAVERAALEAWGRYNPQPVLTYLANYITAGDNRKGKIPYSTVAALDPRDQPPLGPLVSTSGQPILELSEGEIVLNSWAADDLARQGVSLAPGDAIELTYFEPTSTHGQATERSETLRLKAVAALEGAAADPALTPELRGVTDEESLADWNPPFPYDPDRVRSTPPEDQDERYWDEHRATPKAFVSLATGRRLWSSRFGHTTSLCVPPQAGLTAESLAAELESALARRPEALGFALQPVKRQGLEAARGTTPFNLLFLGFSFFLIAAAVMLVGLLFRLGIDGRAQQIGVLAAVGFARARVGRLLLAEGAAVATLGALAGAAAGVGYAWLMLAGLRTPGWWLSAVNTPFLRLYVGPVSLVVGFACGVLVSMAAIAWALWQMRHLTVRRLLSNQASEPAGVGPRRRATRFSRLIAGGALLVAAVAVLAGTRLRAEAQAGAFLGSGALVLTALITLLWSRLRGGDTGHLVAAGGWPLARLALRNAARFPGRSTLTIGLMAAASFLIISVSAFRLEPPEAIHRRTSGSGGYSLLAESSLPIYHDLATEEGRVELGFSSTASRQLEDVPVFALRYRPGDDASCLNLYQTSRPRLLGLPPAMTERGGFDWAGAADRTPEERQNPWLLLARPLERRSSAGTGDDAVVPVVIDANTATYSLHLDGVGDTFEMPDGRGGRLVLEVVGLLKNSIFQGYLLMSERNFLEHFPDTSGYRYFLFDVPPRRVDEVESALESTLGDYGFDAVRTQRRLAQFMVVQNTYLSTFQSLGGLGLLLGAVGLAVVQLRNVLERRGELALLRATGFRRARVAGLVLLENSLLLAGGLAAGLLAALVAVLPHWWSGGASVPWSWLAATLGAVLVVGLLAGAATVRATLATPILPALRGE